VEQGGAFAPRGCPRCAGRGGGAQRSGRAGTDRGRRDRRVRRTGALVLPLVEGDGQSRVRLLSDGSRLYLAGEAAADTTVAGFDQFRFWYHLDLSPAMPYERAFLDGSGRVNVMRSAVFPWGNNTRERTDWHTHGKANGASRADGYRRYELVLDLEEAGLHRGVPFPAFFDIEGDPVRDAEGKFRSRTIVGRLGHRKEPVWLRITP
jgi:hypothetical protein